MKNETKAQKMTRLAAQDRAGVVQLRAPGADYAAHADALEKRAAARELSARAAQQKQQH